MNSIKINLDHEVNFVLTDEENRVVAIINVPLGTTDIDNKLGKAISDDTGDSFEKFQTELNIQLDNVGNELSFEAYIEEEDEDRYLRTYYLMTAEIY
jgi:hypothetical protein